MERWSTLGATKLMTTYKTHTPLLRISYGMDDSNLLQTIHACVSLGSKGQDAVNINLRTYPSAYDR